jgi:hypothetical protein
MNIDSTSRRLNSGSTASVPIAVQLRHAYTFQLRLKIVVRPRALLLSDLIQCPLWVGCTPEAAEIFEPLKFLRLQRLTMRQEVASPRGFEPRFSP